MQHYFLKQLYFTFQLDKWGKAIHILSFKFGHLVKEEIEWVVSLSLTVNQTICQE